MSKMNAEEARWDSLRVNFTIMMWAFLFFLPVQIPGFKAAPDVLAWVLLLIAVGATVRHVAGLGLLWGTAAAGLALWVVRFLVAWRAEAPAWAAVALYMAMWALVTAFVVQLAALIRRVASQTGADDVARSAARRVWLPLVPLVLFAVNPFVPSRWGLLFTCAYLLVTACVISLVMGIAAGAARMCAHAAKQEPGDEADSAPREPPGPPTHVAGPGVRP